MSVVVIYGRNMDLRCGPKLAIFGHGYAWALAARIPSRASPAGPAHRCPKMASTAARQRLASGHDLGQHSTIPGARVARPALRRRLLRGRDVHRHLLDRKSVV